MTLEEFWKLIETTASSDDPDDCSAEIQSALALLPASEIIDFEKQMSRLLTMSYTNALWGAAYLINGGCSDDGFDYFCGWLITQGQSAFENALSDPDSLADLPGLEEEVECEGILYVARSAYHSVTGDEIPAAPIQRGDLGEDWDFDDDDEMKERYPKLFAKFCEE